MRARIEKNGRLGLEQFQYGLDKNLLCRIHDNKMLPECCPVHAMGVNVFTNPHIIDNNSRLFPGEHHYHRCSYLLKRFIEDKKEDLANYGSVENLGSHSIHKGAAYYCSSGSMVHPSIFSICFRAGWTISGDKECYLKYENDGYQFVSRLACGIKPSSPEFSIRPPYFDTTNKSDGK